MVWEEAVSEEEIRLGFHFYPTFIGLLTADPQEVPGCALANDHVSTVPW